MGSALPAPDATGTTNLSATSGKIALVRDTADLTCGATAGSCSAAALVEDLIGFGTAGDYEGSGAAPALSSTTAAIRGGSGCSDTDANAADFAAAAPAPRNSAAAAHACSTTPPAGPSATQTAAVEVQVEAALSLSLEKATLNFGTTTAGAAPAPVSERVTVLSNHPAGYALTVHRSAFAPADLPLAIQATAPCGRHARVGARRRRPRTGADRAVRADDRPDERDQRSERRHLAHERRLCRAVPDGRAGPLHGDGHVHGDRPVILAPGAAIAALALVAAGAPDGIGRERPLASLSASPTRIALSGSSRASVTLTNYGATRAQVSVRSWQLHPRPARPTCDRAARCAERPVVADLSPVGAVDRAGRESGAPGRGARSRTRAARRPPRAPPARHATEPRRRSRRPDAARRARRGARAGEGRSTRRRARSARPSKRSRSPPRGHASRTSAT